MNRRMNVKCTKIDDNGYGIFNIGKNQYKLTNLLPNEEAIVEVQSKGKYNNIRLIKIVSPADKRTNPKCEIYNSCGGCQLLHMKYNFQLEFKKDYCINAYKEYGINIKIDELIAASNQFGYRNKMQVAYQFVNGKIIYGFFEENSHKIIPLNKCLVQSDIQNEIVKFVQDLMVNLKLQAYNEDKRTGLIRFVLIKESFNKKQLLVTIVTSTDVFPGRNEFIKRLRDKFPQITTIIQNVNPRSTSIILGEQERVLFGKGYIEDELLGLNFKISSKTFYQINPEQTVKLYSKVIEYGDFRKDEVVIDAYCGVGTIGMIVAKYVKHVIGVELNKQSVINAKNNARENSVRNIDFICEDATKYLVELAKEKVNIDVVIMDPPRSGSTPQFLDSLIALKPKKIVYVSCDTKTQARDIKHLEKHYNIKKVSLIDMFVGTYHVESVVLLERKK